MSETGLRAAQAKMTAAGVHQKAIDVFTHYYAQLEEGVTGFIAEDSITPLESLDLLESVSVADEDARAARPNRHDQTQRRARHLDGHGQGEVPAAGTGRKVLPRHHR